MATDNKEQEQGYRVDGMGQIIEMLAVADAPFRDSLLKRIAAKDRKLAASIMERLIVLGVIR